MPSPNIKRRRSIDNDYRMITAPYDSKNTINTSTDNAYRMSTVPYDSKHTINTSLFKCHTEDKRDSALVKEKLTIASQSGLTIMTNHHNQDVIWGSQRFGLTWKCDDETLIPDLVTAFKSWSDVCNVNFPRVLTIQSSMLDGHLVKKRIILRMNIPLLLHSSL